LTKNVKEIFNFYRVDFFTFLFFLILNSIVYSSAVKPKVVFLHLFLWVHQLPRVVKMIWKPSSPARLANLSLLPVFSHSPLSNHYYLMNHNQKLPYLVCLFHLIRPMTWKWMEAISRSRVTTNNTHQYFERFRWCTTYNQRLRKFPLSINHSILIDDSVELNLTVGTQSQVKNSSFRPQYTCAPTFQRDYSTRLLCLKCHLWGVRSNDSALCEECIIYT
jgi:hypothetical protein